MLKKIEAEVIKNAKNGTDDMFIDAKQTLDFDYTAWDTYKLLFKGKTIVDFQAASYKGTIDSKKTQLFIDDKQIDGLNINTISELLNAFKAIYKKQQDTRHKRQKKIIKELERRKKIEEEKQKKVAESKPNAKTIFNMVGEKIFGKGEQR